MREPAFYDFDKAEREANAQNEQLKIAVEEELEKLEIMVEKHCSGFIPSEEDIYNTLQDIINDKLEELHKERMETLKQLSRDIDDLDLDVSLGGMK